MKLTKEVKVALLVLLALTLLIFGFNFLKGNNLLSSNRTFYAKYDNVEGLTKSSVVTINGLQVGKVVAVDFVDATGKLMVTFIVESDFEFGKNSLAKIYGNGFIGGKNLAIVPEVNPTVLAKDKDILPSKTEGGIMDMVTSTLNPLQAKVAEVITKTDAMLSSVNKVLKDENIKQIDESLKSLTGSLQALKYTTGSIQSLVVQNDSKLNATITNFKTASDNINTFSSELSKAPVSEMITKLNTTVNTLSTVAEKVKTGSGTAGKLINDPSVYNNLDRATKQLDMLLQDMKLNPKRYVHFSVFGKKEKQYQKPKDSLK